LNPLPLLSSLVSLAALYFLAVGYIRTKHVYKLILAISFATVLIGTFLEFYSSIAGWSTALYKVYYFTSPLTPAIMSLGLIAYVRRRSILYVLTAYYTILALVLAYSVIVAQVDTSTFELGPAIGGEGMPRSARMLSPLFTIPGGLILLVGGLALSYTSRLKIPTYPLIAIGALVFMIAGFILRLGYGNLFLALELVGVAIFAYAFATLR